MRSTVPEALSNPTENIENNSNEDWLELTEAIFRGETFSNVVVEVSPTADTSATQAAVDKNGQMHLKMIFSKSQIESIPPEARGRSIRLVLHELGHVADFITEGKAELKSQPDAFFYNITDDLAIDSQIANRTAYMKQAVQTDYRERKVPPEVSRQMSEIAPRHQQFLFSVMAVSMLEDGILAPEFTVTDEVLERCGLEDSPAEVKQAVAEVFNYTDDNDEVFNLVQQMVTQERSAKRSGKSDQQALRARRNIATNYIKPLYDQLLEQDRQEHADNTEDDSGNGEFDYGDSPCSHGQQIQVSFMTEADPEESDQDGKESSSDNSETDKDSVESGSGESDDEADSEGFEAGDSDQDETEALGRQDSGDDELSQALKQILGELDKPEISKKLQQAKSEFEAEQQAKREAEEEEQRRQNEKLRLEYDLPESQFAEYMQVARRNTSTINELANIIASLKSEREEAQMSARRKASTNVGQIHPLRAALFLAKENSLTRGTPDFYDTPELKEKIRYEFDGLDVFFLTDCSGSMSGAKAEAASETATVMLEALRLLQSEAIDDLQIDDLVRISVVKFGASNAVLSPLSSQPTPKHLGQTFAAIRNANDGNTLVAAALEDTNKQLEAELRANPDSKRLRLVILLSDGLFGDQSRAEAAAAKMPIEQTHLVQLMFGGKPQGLTKAAITEQIKQTHNTPKIILTIVSQLIERLRT